MTDEQRHLTELVVERVAQMQRAVVAALPGATTLHAEFLVGEPMPTTPRDIVRLGRLLAGPAKEYRALLLNRGLDAAALARFERALIELEAFGFEDEKSEPRTETVEPAKKTRRPAPKSTKAKRT